MNALLFSMLGLASALSATGCSSDTTSLADSGLPDAGACANDDACPVDQHCENSACVPGTGNACTMDSECGAGETCMVVPCMGTTRCHGNTCVARSCTTNADCNGWICEGGVCIEPPACSNAMPCPPNSTCNANTGHCEPTAPMACMRDRDCMTMGDICVAGMCVPGTMCTTSMDCPSDQRCIRMACRPPCTMDSDCGQAFAWHCDTASGECQQRCTSDALCPMNTICENNLCVAAECMTNADCTMMSFECQGNMNGHGRCVEVFPCDAPGGCPTGTACNMTTNRCDPLPQCVGDRGCTGDTYCQDGYCQPSTNCSSASCMPGFDCVGNVCVPSVCRGNADCTGMGEQCIGGSCQVPPPPTTITQVRIITAAGVVRPGTTYQFTAVALDQAGAVVPGVTFMWTSTSTNVASIDASGLATGGNRAGTTFIIASVNNGTSTITSPSVTLVNLGPLAMNDLRITVIGLSGGSPVSGAQVAASGSFGELTATTDMTGVVTFAGAAPQGPYSVTVAHANYDYVTVLGLESSDVLIPLPPVTKPSIAGGIKGTDDLSRVRTTGQASIGLNGASIASPLMTFDAAQLFGGNIFQVTVPSPTGGTMMIPIPAANTLSVDFGGINFPVKDTYYAKATTGLRAAWALGGRLGLTGLGGGGGGGLNNIIGAILPYLQLFDHAVRPVVDVVSIPTVVDANDIDGDGDSMEMVPDYNSFPAVPLTPDTQQSLRYFLSVANLPFVSGGNANTLIVVAGTILPSVGFVPLGLDGMQDMNGSGIVDPFITKIAPAHGGLEVGEYAVLATAVRIEPGALPGPGSARLFVGPTLPASVDLRSRGWLDSPTGATWDAMSRQVTLPEITHASFYHLSFAAEDGTWHVYTNAPMGPATSVAVPQPPGALVDRAAGATITVDAVDLAATSNASTLFDLETGGVAAIDRATQGFSRAIIGP